MTKTETFSTMLPLLSPEIRISTPIKAPTNRLKISKCSLIKVFMVMAGLTFLSLLMDENLEWNYKEWKPIRYRENVVWINGLTMAVLEFLGRERTLVNCRLILVETRLVVFFIQIH